VGGGLLVEHVRVERKERGNLDDGQGRERRAVLGREPAGRVDGPHGLGIVRDRDEDSAEGRRHASTLDVLVLTEA
jgi:hypothetical protein